MPLLSLSPPLWSRIFDYACQDDGTTGLSLSTTSRDARALSASHRYQSVRIIGWRQLLAFEGVFENLPKEHQGIVNLYVKLPSVFEAGYPDDGMWAPEDESDDESYVPSEDGDESSDESEADNEAEGSYTQGSPKGYESTYDPDGTVDALLLNPKTGTPLEYDPRPSFQAEGHLYSTMSRLLDACSHSLEVFTLHWKPQAASQCGAAFILPESLPKLQSLAVWQESVELYKPSSNTWEKRIAQGLENRVTSLPSLERLEMNVTIDGNWPEHLALESTQLKYATAPCASVKRLHDLGATRIRVFCNCAVCFPVEWPVSRASFRASAIDFDENWEDQVICHSTHTGFAWRDPTPSDDEDDEPPTPAEGSERGPKPEPTTIYPLSEFDLMMKDIIIGVFRSLDEKPSEPLPQNGLADEEEETFWMETPASETREAVTVVVKDPEGPAIAVLVFAWLEDGDDAEYLDAVLLADKRGYIRLDDHAQRLESRGLEKGTQLEMYDISRKVWSPVTMALVLGPFPSRRVIFLRRRGVKQTNHFDAFLALGRHAI